MAYELYLSENAQENIRKLDNTARIMILKWLKKNVDGCIDPRIHGKTLEGKLSGYWRYRIGDYRVICAIFDNELVVLAIVIKKRDEVYDIDLPPRESLTADDIKSQG